MDYTDAILTDHAEEQLAKRALTADDIAPVLDSPDTILPVREGRIILQRVLPMDEPPRDYLMRVVVDIDRKPPEVVTVYRTSKIEKYRNRP